MPPDNQSPYGRSSQEQPPYGQPSQGQSPYGWPAEDYGQPSQGQSSYGRTSEPQSPYGRSAESFGGPAEPQSPFGGPAETPSPFGGPAETPSPFGGPAENPSAFGWPAQDQSSQDQSAQGPALYGPASHYGQSLYSSSLYDKPNQDDTATDGASKRKRGPMFWLLAVGLPVVLLGAGGYFVASMNGVGVTTASASPSPTYAVVNVGGEITVKGDPNIINISNGQNCSVKSGPNTDIKEGTPVVVTNSYGKTIARGALTIGTVQGQMDCVFIFQVPGVSAEEKSYGVQIGRRQRMDFNSNQISAPIMLVLGN
ncbi:hypothetical protein [Sphaerisporangium siamense]|uniref:Uncharacterized protein n=1 Tax=Sphaerisporangium siamense TaxID=795645 RepID=A0A7W7GAF4_9ACTN|nr:hypothetical protein [Sphaerisporangium siamense]MBB4702367.1 hypothetical protein [Sphaerisporangium siamense]